MKPKNEGIKKKGFEKTTIIMILLAIPGSILAVITLYYVTNPPPKKVEDNIEIVLDRSEAMKAPFENTTKIKAAIEAVNESMTLEVAEKDNLALRVFGGPCQENNTELLVSFAQHNEENVQNKLEEVQVKGQTTLACAVVEAIGDFNDPERFGDVKKTIIIVTVGKDTCVEEPEKHIAEKLKGRDIDLKWRIIGIGVESKEQLMSLRRLASASIPKIAGEVLIANNREDLVSMMKMSLSSKELPQNLPTLSIDPDLKEVDLYVGQGISFEVQAKDLAGTAPLLVVEEKPEGAVFKKERPNKGIFSWTPTQNQTGSHTIKFMAYNGALEKGKTVSITVKKKPTAHQPEKHYKIHEDIALFAFDKSTLKSDTKKRLDSLAEECRRLHKIHSIVLTGYTCSIGAKAYNLKLGQRRAEVVRDYLIKQEIDVNLIAIKSKGEDEPLANNRTREGRARNRRVKAEIKAECLSKF